MLIKNEMLETPEDNPFKNDKLDRECIANNLEKIIDSISTSMVLSIDSSWGKGKTTFINMWRRRMDTDNKYNTLYFNAWENDDCDDPLLAMISEMESTLLKDDTYESVKSKLKKYAIPLMKAVVPTALKILTGNIINVDAIKNVKLEELAGKVGEASLSLYNEEKNYKNDFKNALIEYQKMADKKVIFFIDELDRCRPTFAIKTLEKIKHLFSIPNFIFILALDKEQLSFSVQTLYGQNMDANNYLKRFIDLEYSLPEPDIDNYINYLLDSYNVRNDKTEYFELIIKGLTKKNNLSLREIDKLFNYLSIILPMSELTNSTKKYNENYLFIYGAIYSFFPLLKVKSSKVFSKFSNGENIFNEISGLIDFNIITLSQNSSFKNHFYNLINKLLDMNIELKNGTLTSGQEIHFPDVKNSIFRLNNLIDRKDNSSFKFINLMQFVDDFKI